MNQTAPAIPSPERWSRSAVRDLAALARDSGCSAAEDEPLARHVSMGVGGSCAAMLWPNSPDSVSDALAWMNERGLPARVLGGGTNLLAGAARIDAVVINLTEMTATSRWMADGAVLPAGMTTAAAVRGSIERGLDGLVWASGLPGTIGGAAAGNAGCWGGDMASTVAGLELARRDGERILVGSDDLSWDYRTLDIDDAAGSDAVIVAVHIDLEAGDAADLRGRYEHLHELKRSQQPSGARSSGCIFRNPAGERTAGELIDQAGCKGLRVGGAEVSSLHANFILNHGNATPGDIDELIDTVILTVADRFGIRLEPEIRRW